MQSENFLTLISSLTQACANCGNFIKNAAGIHDWMLPQGVSFSSTAEIGNKFKPQLGNALTDSIANSYPVGITQAINVQINYLGCAERAFRSRHMSSVSALAKSCGRFIAAGEGAGFNDINNYVQQLIGSSSVGG